MSNRPTEQEYAAFYADYVSRVPEEDVAAALEAQSRYTLDVLNSFSNEEAGRLHGTTKWTLKETLGHLCDGERVFSYRAMRIARGDRTPLASFEQDDYVAEGNFNERDWDNLIAEYSALRRATIAFARGTSPEYLSRMGTASENPVSARALLYITVGHERRHIELMREHACG
ncbi:MAG TPA: DinB family protein [Terriglobales bacterium]|nr:DinB family protein [Terriglobales bacterium]